ncbi:hypothetical protein H6G80_33710 [Nostoc sp. FACHB-87]|uniref:hypothetical protein n=1 Tax=Nostocales TaxID=1161 RepID=UPI001684DFD8|nr:MULTISPECIES: hypothetical protein [Nostocales]MBD2303386.1 hypothetical protein [Nostoc sp. FACHB-190]MBD2458995.1 hypothetical protein [Nostoc sp. FACHB-87]MBD2480006.1 hypothetical protein [Anabaena sp. FACHB-83]MBD2492132.1 hypothetical protein [Aulosira sp. FACHB-615]
MKSLSTLIQNKILLAILAGVVSIGSFQVWKYNQEKYQKFIAERETECQVGLAHGKTSVYFSYSLRRLKYENVANPKLNQPGITSEFRKDAGYVIIKTKPDYLIPPNVDNYDSPFFKTLSSVGEFAPPPLDVTAISIDTVKKEALVSSYCSKTPFRVLLKDLYETYQAADAEDPLSLPNLLN